MNVSVTPQNQLLSALSSVELQAFLPHFERVSLELNHVIEVAHHPISFVYFPEDGLASIVAETENDMRVENGLFGREGMSGTSLLSGDTESSFDCFAQMKGAALRIATASFLEIIAESPSIRKLFERYAKAANVQVAYTSLATAKANINSRLARWLIMAHDRSLQNCFTITHERLAAAMGCRRPGVTVALHVIEGQGLIRSIRSQITVTNRAGLILMAGSTYGPAEREYRRLTGLALGGGDDAQVAGPSSNPVAKLAHGVQRSMVS